jgi:hypothetical protein
VGPTEETVAGEGWEGVVLKKMSRDADLPSGANLRYSGAGRRAQ